MIPEWMRPVEEGVFVAGQIDPADLPSLVSAGVTIIVNNRPDDEEPGQPRAVEIAEAANRCGIASFHLPIADRIGNDQVGTMARLLEGRKGAMLAFCRAGTRSAWLWALARASQGEDPDRIIEAAARAGQDLHGLRGMLRARAAAR